MKKMIAAAGLSVLLALCSYAQNPVSTQKDSVKALSAQAKPVEEKKKNWYEVISLKGYAQFRYNRLLETNSSLKCDQCDKSIGNNGGFFLRRARLVFSGNVHERLFIYIQTDVATNATSGSTIGLNYLQIRDFYGDVYLTKDRKLRARVGISKVPFGFDNLQSSQNRIAFDRSDAINSSTYNERDLGVFFYYTPQKIRDRFKYLIESGLKGTGDYGMFGGGLYNGQTANRSELNNTLHSVLRATYPFQVGSKQMIEVGVQGYSGLFHVGEAMSPSAIVEGGQHDYKDQRVAASFILYPQPFGIQAEYMYGQGPVFNYTGGPAPVNQIITGVNEGGYVQMMYMTKVKNMVFTPYARGQYFFGGKKVEMDARRHVVKEVEIGLEYQIIKQLEVTAAYTISDRVFEDSKNPVNHQTGNFMRIQLQFNY